MHAPRPPTQPHPSIPLTPGSGPLALIAQSPSWTSPPPLTSAGQQSSLQEQDQQQQQQQKLALGLHQKPLLDEGASKQPSSVLEKLPVPLLATTAPPLAVGGSGSGSSGSGGSSKEQPHTATTAVLSGRLGMQVRCVVHVCNQVQLLQNELLEAANPEHAMKGQSHSSTHWKDSHTQASYTSAHTVCLLTAFVSGALCSWTPTIVHTRLQCN